MKKLLMKCALIVGLAFGNAHAAVLQVDSNGILTGASGVHVGSQLYDVELTNYLICHSCMPDLFVFHDSGTANMASHALLDQVFLDTKYGAFDSLSWMVNDCNQAVAPEMNEWCATYTPYDVEYSGSHSEIFSSIAVNWADIDDDFVTWGPCGNSFYCGAEWNDNIAVWTLHSAVPEPGLLALLGAGLLALLATRRPARIRRALTK